MNLSGSLLENFLNASPGRSRTTGHERGAIAGAFLTSRHTRPNEEVPLGLEFLHTTDCVRIVRVSAVNNDVALFEMWGQLMDEVIYSSPSFNKKDDLAGALEF